MAVTAEQINNQPWLLAQEAYPAAELQARVRLRGYLGATAVRGEVAHMPVVETADDATMKSALELAAAGDEASKRVVRNNVSSDVWERLKVTKQRSAYLKMVDGQVAQEGRKLIDVNLNTLKNTILTAPMLRRAHYEAHNVLLFEELHKIGATKDHDVIFWSPTPTDMTTEEKAEYNFFLDTESLSIQRMSVTGDNVVLETAFVAGKATPASPRHDIDAILKLAANKDIAIHTIDGTDMLQYVMLVPKSELPNGVVNIVQRYDEAVGGTFYGEAKPQEDYIAYAAECEQRNGQFDNIVDTIQHQMIAEAAFFDTPLEVIERLDYLSDRLCGERSIHDKSINLAIFGPVAALHFETARFHLERGNQEQANYSLRRGQATSSSSSCPLFRGVNTSETDDGSDGGAASSESTGKKLMNCPQCDAKVFADPCSRVLCCWDCGAKASSGVVIDGNGGSKARKAKKIAEQKQAAQKVKVASRAVELSV